jgi:N-acetylglucosamine malate deacetylase 2
MRILYIFPHPDDECFGPAPAIARQIRLGHEVHLLTLTRGGATSQRHRLGLTVEEMGEIRFNEMLAVEEALGLHGMTVLNLPDSGLSEMDPRKIEAVTEAEIVRVEPDVVATYAVHGVSGFPDHLVTHAVVKRVFCELREDIGSLRRLALFTLPDREHPEGKFRLSTSPDHAIDAAEVFSDADLEIGKRALACYVSYHQVIEETRPLEQIGKAVHFELFQESFDPWLGSIVESL